MQKQSAQKTLMIILGVVVVIILAGIVSGQYYASLPGHNPQENKPNCESVGGEWIEDRKTCVVSSKKIGEICTDGGQCESGICSPLKLTDEQRATIEKESLKNMTGTCSADNFATGCIEQVIMGTVSKESMCLGN
ncbi:MAG: hypothetical protein WAV31_03750 [Candidatus Moraniibacteriota bacterium]